MTIIPLDDRILVRPTDNADGTLTRGTVIAAGTGTIDGTSRNKRPAVQAGDTILFEKHLGSEVTFGGVRYWMMKASDIVNIEVRAVTVALYGHATSSRSSHSA